MRIVVTVLKKSIKFILFILISIIFLLAIPYLNTTYFYFPVPEKFEGEVIYNPYDNLDDSLWYKANFQVQSYAWSGFTDGRANTNELIDSIYRYLEYDIIATSDYMKINRFQEDEPFYIPVYEHGYSIFKHHHVCLGAEKVDWRDYFYFQNLHHKQQLINKLKKNNELVFIAHPKLRKAFDPKDFAYLTNYDGIEVLNNYRKSTEHWDAALSSGHYAAILANDDAHDISNPDEVGQFCTFINSETVHSEDILKSVKEGRSFGAEIFRNIGESYVEKKAKLKQIAKVESVKLVNDTIFINVDRQAKKIRFIGQDGEIRKAQMNSNKAKYLFQQKDSYIRIEIFFQNDNIFYLNPLVRYDGQSLSKPELEGKNIVRTWIFRVLTFIVLTIFFFNMLYIWKWVRK